MSINESGAGTGCKERVTAAVAAVVVAAAVLRGAGQQRRRRWCDNGWLKTFCQLDRACAVRDYY